jgi:hypothetical protein
MHENPTRLIATHGIEGRFAHLRSESTNRSKGLRPARLGAARGGLGGLLFIVENMQRFAIGASAGCRGRL